MFLGRDWLQATGIFPPIQVVYDYLATHYKNTQNFPFYHQLQTACPHQPLYKLNWPISAVEKNQENSEPLTSPKENLSGMLDAPV